MRLSSSLNFLRKSINVSKLNYLPFQSVFRPFSTRNLSFENKLIVHRYDDKPLMSAYRVMDKSGNIIDSSQDPQLGKEKMIEVYKKMVTLNVMDTTLEDAQRQGRISFYMTSFGEEAIHMGSAAALTLDDMLFMQYREVGVLLWRGFTLENVIDQCCSNEADPCKGRQMPVHYGSKKLNLQTISSPLATQIPQAVGAAYSYKLEGKRACVICYFGEGAASEGDFHAGLNFAATLSTPIIFFCRNNHYAISTSAEEQYRGDGIASRGAGYGIDTIRVDGNDFFAVYNATLQARKIAIEEQRPVLIEAMSYRIGHHSTSDDSTRYRSVSEIEGNKKENNSINRLLKYLEAKDWWKEEMDKDLIKSIQQQVRNQLKESVLKKKPSISEMFTDVYDVPTPNIIEQRQQLEEHLKIYGQHYNLDEFRN
eukprot:TRINITY_DN1771_c1_g2_i2.p1 TRINITY_DN1771_c1_g2~~TRINITY_DN1771_c1_g2_i2.p1  ORF type:complete len:423 (+),score=177.20 TRINITY_DN1771_c1_g2_i2:135-1403(+)